MRKNLHILVFYLIIFSILFVSCGSKKGQDEFINLGPSQKAEKILTIEAEILPDFSVHTYEDETLMVVDTPPDTVWITADMPDFGSSMTKKGGTFHDAFSQYPENYRFIGPRGNHLHRTYMNTSTGVTWVSSETKEFFPVTAY